MTLQFLGYALPGAVVLAFGVGWSWSHAATPAWSRSYCAKGVGCVGVRWPLARHPVQGTLKLVVALVGVVGSLFAAYPDGSFQYVGDVPFATVYLFFALSGVLDVLACYCPRAVGRGHARLGLALAFFMEAFLFHSAELGQVTVSPAGRQALQLLVAVMVTCGASSALGGMLPDTTEALIAVEAVRCVAAVVHGTWLYHCGVLLYWPTGPAPSLDGEPAPWVALAFAWHCAAAVSLLIVFLVTRRSPCTARRPLGHPVGPPMPMPIPMASVAGPTRGLHNGMPRLHHASPLHSCLLCDAATTSSYHRSSSLA